MIAAITPSVKNFKAAHHFAYVFLPYTPERNANRRRFHINERETFYPAALAILIRDYGYPAEKHEKSDLLNRHIRSGRIEGRLRPALLLFLKKITEA